MNLLQLAVQARLLFPKAAKAFSADAFLLWTRQGFVDFVAESGRVWRKETDITFSADVSEYAMPEDCRQVISLKVPTPATESLTISSAVRANDVVTITVATPMTWETGDTVAIDGVTNSTFDEAGIEITWIDSTHFLYVQTGSDATSSGGTATNSWDTYPPGEPPGPDLITDRDDIQYYIDTLTTSGYPLYYYWSDATHICFLPAPTSDYPSATLTYDGKVPADWGDSDTLPLPDYVGPALIGYACWQAALSLDPVDEAQAQRRLGEYKTGKARYNAGLHIATGAPTHNDSAY